MVRPVFNALGLVSEETYISFAETNVAAGYQLIKRQAPHDVPLAIVGGGPSAGHCLEELKSWPGHIWAVNQGAEWLIKNGRTENVWMFTVDPGVELAEMTTGVERAYLGTSCHPKLFETLAEKGADIQMFHTRQLKGVSIMRPEDLTRSETNPQGPKTEMFGPSSVCRVFYPAALMGYRDVTFFGCEGSFEGSSHAYRNEHRPRQMIVRCGDREFFTTPDYYMTTQFLANVMREYPKLKEKSGGLLRGMLEHWDTYDVVALSEVLRDAMCPDMTEPYEVKVA